MTCDKILYYLDLYHQQSRHANIDYNSSQKLRADARDRNLPASTRPHQSYQDWQDTDRVVGFPWSAVSDNELLDSYQQNAEPEDRSLLF